MKSKKIEDERVLQLNHKIQSEAYNVVLFLLATSVFIKSYVMNMSLSQYVVELGIIVLSILYIIVRSVFVGTNFVGTAKGGKIFTISSILVLSLGISIANGIRNYSLYSDKYTGIFDGLFISTLVITFISSVVFISAAFAILYWFNKRGQQRIDERLNKDDEQD